MRSRFFAAIAAAVLSSSLPAASQSSVDWKYPAVEAGPVVPIPNATAKPAGDLRYRVVFNITQGTPGDGRISSDLASVARFVNLLAISNMDPKASGIVAVVHAAATPAVIAGQAYRNRFGSENPNAELVRQLEESGVDVVVCGQAVAGAGFPLDAVMDNVDVSISALNELAQLQLQGYALMP